MSVDTVNSYGPKTMQCIGFTIADIVCELPNDIIRSDHNTN